MLRGVMRKLRRTRLGGNQQALWMEWMEWMEWTQWIPVLLGYW